MENENKLNCYCCGEAIILTKESKINKLTTLYDGDFYHKECFKYEKYGKPYQRPNRECYSGKIISNII